VEQQIEIGLFGVGFFGMGFDEILPQKPGEFFFGCICTGVPSLNSSLRG